MGNNFLENALEVFLHRNNGGQRLNPTQQNYVDVLKSNDANRGEQLARNICKTMGVSEQEAYNQAKQFFGGMFGA